MTAVIKDAHAAPPPEGSDGRLAGGKHESALDILYPDEHSLQPSAAFPSIDFAGLSAGLLQGGADTVANRFDILVQGPYEQILAQFCAFMCAGNVRLVELPKSPFSSRTDCAQFYFEVGKIGNIHPTTQSGPLIEGGKHAIVPSASTSLVSQNVRIHRSLPVIGEQIEQLRRIMHEEPVSRGIIEVAVPYSSDPESTALRCSIASRAGDLGLSQQLARYFHGNAELTLFSTAFMVDRNKKVGGVPLSRATLKSLDGFAECISLDFQLPNRDFGWLDEITRRYGLWVNGELARGANATRMDGFAEFMWVARLGQPGERGPSVEVREDDSEKQPNFQLQLRGRYRDEELIAAFTDILHELRERRAHTSRTWPFYKVHNESEASYLPSYPFSNHDVISISYNGSGAGL